MMVFFSTRLIISDWTSLKDAIAKSRPLVAEDCPACTFIIARSPKA
jgi:hypothetical protein